MGSLPSVIGQYRVIRQLGEGGMGAVFEAIHEGIQRRVAIKVLLPHAERSAETINRFINEARAVNIVDHPGVVEITEFGHLPDGSGYLVMEYLKGETLSERLEGDGGKLSPSEVVHIGIQIAAAVAAAHKKKIIHRDLKPSNVMLVPDMAMPTGERVKVLDFGLAKISEAVDAAVKTKTQGGMGTALYMSPEQCDSAKNVDGKTDVYALGCMLYELLSGQPPFMGDGYMQILGKHMFKQHEPLASKEPRVPAPLATLIDKLLIKAREQRPKMREVQVALESLAAGLPPPPRRQEAEGSAVIDAARIASLVAGSQAATSQATTRRMPRQKGLVVLAGCGVLASGLVTLVLLWPSGPKRPTPVAVPIVTSPAVKPAPPASTKRVTVSVKSHPSGAQIVRVPDGEVLGVTPWDQSMPQADAPLRVRVRLNRYAEQERTLSRQHDDTADVKLVATESRRQAIKNPTNPQQRTPTTSMPSTNPVPRTRIRTLD